MKVLFVDDDNDDVELFGEALLQIDNSINFLNASNGSVAMEMLHSTPDDLPDFIFLDINMPVMNGMECLEQIRKHDALSKLRVVMYSTSKYPGDYDRAIELGAEYWVKPPSYDSLVETLKFKYIAPSGLTAG